MLPIGTTAPTFEAGTTQGRFHLSQFLGRRPIVLLFYPKNETPVCTRQLCAVRDAKEQYDKYDAFVAGVNPASLYDHEIFAENHLYNFPIFADVDQSIRKKYKVGKLLGLFAQERVVYVIGLDKTIIYAAKGEPSTEEILNVLEQHMKQPRP